MSGHCLWPEIDSRKPKTTVWFTRQSSSLQRTGCHWSFSSGLLCTGAIGSLNSSYGHFPSSRIFNLSKQTASFRILTFVPWHVDRGLLWWKAKWKPLELPLCKKRTNQKWSTSLGESQRLEPPLRTWNIKRWWFPQHTHLPHLFGLCRS